MKNKGEAGATGMDIVAGIIIFMLSATIVASIYYHIYVTTTQIKIHQYAIGCITDIFEKIDLESYENINDTKIKDLIDKSGMNEYFNKEKNDSYIDYSLENYQSQSKVKQDLIKKINITVVYTVGEKQVTLPISKIKVKESR